GRKSRVSATDRVILKEPQNRGRFSRHGRNRPTWAITLPEETISGHAAVPGVSDLFSARMQANLVEIETDVVLMLVLPTGGSAPTSTKPFHTGGYPIRLSGLSRHSHQTKKESRTLGWCPRLLAPLRCGIDRGNVPHTFILAEA